MAESVIKPHDPEPFVPRGGSDEICRRCLGPLDHPAHDLPEAQYEGEWHRWGCARCGSVFDMEYDPRGEIVTCLDCQTRQRVQT